METNGISLFAQALELTGISVWNIAPPFSINLVDQFAIFPVQYRSVNPESLPTKYERDV